jgi:hypothetical protein
VLGRIQERGLEGLGQMSLLRVSVPSSNLLTHLLRGGLHRRLLRASLVDLVEPPGPEPLIALELLHIHGEVGLDECVELFLLHRGELPILLV